MANTQEAAWHGVPTLAVPFTLGQGEIAQHAADHGRGLVVRKETLLAGDAAPLARALRRIVTETGFNRMVRAAVM
jgi:UDP:flavonoid glycosyltransferase YjiC (YdhE family)